MAPRSGTTVRAKVFNFDGRRDVPGAVYAPDGPGEPLGEDLDIVGALKIVKVSTPFGSYRQYWVTSSEGRRRQVEPDTIVTAP